MKKKTTIENPAVQNATPEIKNPVNEKRQQLKDLSQALKPAVTNGDFPNLNSALLDYYKRTSGATTFHTLQGWNKLGYTINKGSKSFLIWGKPVKVSADTPEAYEYFPVSFLFNENQVTLSKKEVQA